MTEFLPESYPPPVKISGLRNHFSSAYQLDKQQVDLMVESSRKSLKKFFAEARAALDAPDPFVQIAKTGHSLKGLLLNMGEEEWADVARLLEGLAKKREEIDYRSVIDKIHEGMVDVLEKGRTE